MTWSEQFENQLKSPPIGSDAWRSCIPADQKPLAGRLLSEKTPVFVQRQPSADRPEFLVVFDETEFVAAGFDDKSAADTFAEEWNHRS